MSASARVFINYALVIRHAQGVNKNSCADDVSSFLHFKMAHIEWYQYPDIHSYCRCSLCGTCLAEWGQTVLKEMLLSALSLKLEHTLDLKFRLHCMTNNLI